MAQWAMQLAMAPVNIASAVIAALATFPAPNIPMGILAGTLGALQLGTILANKPKPQKFATGGIVAGTSYSGDNVGVLANSREMFINDRQQKNLFDIANGTAEAGGGNVNATIIVALDGKQIGKTTFALANDGQYYLETRAVR
jgi:hypothetical protein